MPDPALDASVVRAAALLGPLAASAALWCWRKPNARLATGALLATIWNFPALLGLHLAATSTGWWRFEADGGLLLGLPIDLLLGWMLLWGAIPVLAFHRANLAVPIAAMALLDVALMPLSEPVVVLGDAWLAGELAGIAVALVPALLLGRWTASRRRLAARAAMQVAITGALLLWLLPAAALGEPWGAAAALAALHPVTRWAALALLALAATPGLAAVQEFAERGHGTPLPFDPPSRLVRTGPYRFMRNPMQASATTIVFVTAASTQSARLGAAAIVALAYGAGLARWHEGEDLAQRFGASWTAYTRTVPAWRPRPRPAPSPDVATLWVAAGCSQCSPVATFFLRRWPVGLAVRPAEGHPERRLRRITYETDERRWDGVAALARALGHLHLGWACVGWWLRLPGVVQVLQVLVDAAGGGPRDIPASAPPGGHALSLSRRAASCGSPRA